MFTQIMLLREDTCLKDTPKTTPHKKEGSQVLPSTNQSKNPRKYRFYLMLRRNGLHHDIKFDYQPPIYMNVCFNRADCA